MIRRTLFLMVLFSFALAGADIIELHNGDRMTGTILEVREETLVIETEYAGTVALLIEAVGTVTTSDPGVEAVLRETLEPWDIELILLPPDEEKVVDPMEPEAPETHRKWTGTADIGASMRRGDTETLDANFALTLTRNWPQYILTLRLEGGYSEVESQVNTRRVRGYARLQHYVSDRWYVYGTTAAEHDPGKRLDLRLEAGAGVGYDIIRSERRSLSMDAGLDYSRERWNLYSIRELEQARSIARLERLEAGEALLEYLRALRLTPPQRWIIQDIQRAAQYVLDPFTIRAEQITTSDDLIKVHLGLNFEQKLFKNSVLTEELLYLPQIDDWSDYRIVSDLALTTPLSERLGLRLNLKTEYESDIGNAEDQFTHLLTLALRYAF